MSDQELPFRRRIHTTDTQKHFPAFVQTVEDAIDHLQELPIATLQQDHWQAARVALWDAVDSPMDAAKLAAADTAFCEALRTDGWLNEIKPV